MAFGSVSGAICSVGRRADARMRSKAKGGRLKAEAMRGRADARMRSKAKGKGRKIESRTNKRKMAVNTRFLRGQVSSIYKDLVATNTDPNRPRVCVLCIWSQCVSMTI